MNSDKLFRIATNLWPLQIDISDGIRQSRKMYVFSELNSAYEKIERESENMGSWVEIACWSFHQALWGAAVEKYKSGEKLLKISDVKLSDFEAQIRENLKDECWDQERAFYHENSSM